MVVQHSHTANCCRIRLNVRGAQKYVRMSYPLHAGVYSEIETDTYQLHFNLNNEIIRAKGKKRGWPHPHEWLKRNCGNDWIYYSTGGYTGVFETTGEYYLPNLPYATNSMLGGAFHNRPEVQQVVENWHQEVERLRIYEKDPDPEIRRFLESAAANSPAKLARRADQLFAICGGRSTVLPPDARHVDYNVIPLTIATGCLYKCRFCEVKDKQPFKTLTMAEIRNQIYQLRDHFGVDLQNYNALFLGQHDALNSCRSVLLETLETAYREFRFDESAIQGCSCYLFGSVTALLETPERFFAELEQLPYQVYINIGLESADQETLSYLGKPLTSRQVTDTFGLIQELNDRYRKTEISANFVIGEELPDSHLPAFTHLVRDSLPRVKAKGCIYISPLQFGHPSRAKTFGFNRLKVLSRLPTYLYIIQRL